MSPQPAAALHPGGLTSSFTPRAQANSWASLPSIDALVGEDTVAAEERKLRSAEDMPLSMICLAVPDAPFPEPLAEFAPGRPWQDSTQRVYDRLARVAQSHSRDNTYAAVWIARCVTQAGTPVAVVIPHTRIPMHLHLHGTFATPRAARRVQTAVAWYVTRELARVGPRLPVQSELCTDQRLARWHGTTATILTVFLPNTSAFGAAKRLLQAGATMGMRLRLESARRRKWREDTEEALRKAERWLDQSMSRGMPADKARSRVHSLEDRLQMQREKARQRNAHPSEHTWGDADDGGLEGIPFSLVEDKVDADMTVLLQMGLQLHDWCLLRGARRYRKPSDSRFTFCRHEVWFGALSVGANGRSADGSCGLVAMPPAMATRFASIAAPSLAMVFDIETNSFQSTNTKEGDAVFTDPTQSRDQVMCITGTLTWTGAVSPAAAARHTAAEEPVLRYALSCVPCPPCAGVHLETCASEQELLERFVDVVVRRWDVLIMLGWNTFMFDQRFLAVRMQHYGMTSSTMSRACMVRKGDKMVGVTSSLTARAICRCIGASTSSRGVCAQRR